MAERAPICIRCDRVEHSAVAALATIAHYHGLPIRPAEIPSFVGLEAVTDLGTLVVASRLLGFESVPLEGSIDDLPEVERPNIIVLREGAESRFAILYEIDANSALVADPVRGDVRDVPRAKLAALWTGDCLRIVPKRPQVELEHCTEDGEPSRDIDSPARRAARTGELEHIAEVAGPPRDRYSLEESQRRLALRRSFTARTKNALFGPSRTKNALFLLFSAAVLGLALGAQPISRLAAAPFIALAAASSLWLALFPKQCARCSRAHQLAGLVPLDRLGVLFYTAVLLALRFGFPRAAWPIACALLAASGAHLALVRLLLKEKLACPPCLLIAGCAFAASLLFLFLADWTIPGALAAALSLPAGAAIIAAVLPHARRLAQAESLAESMRIALAWIAEHPRSPDGPTRIVVWKRAGCAACLFFDAVHRPGLEADFEDAIAFEEVDAGNFPIETPLILILGTLSVLLRGLPGREDDYERLRNAVERARDPALAGLESLDGLYLA